MPGLALSERRPWLLASLVFGISYWFAGPNTVPGLYLIVWKGAGVGLLAAYAWAHHPSRGAHLIALVLALGALGDMVLEIDFTYGALSFLAGHLVAIGFYTAHRRPNAGVAVPLALLVTIPVAAGRNLAVLVEAAVRNHVLQVRGIDSTREFIARQAQHMKDDEEPPDVSI